MAEPCNIYKEILENYGWYGNGCLMVLAVSVRFFSSPWILHNPSTHILENLWGPKNWWSGIAPIYGNPMCSMSGIFKTTSVMLIYFAQFGGKKVGTCRYLLPIPIILVVGFSRSVGESVERGPDSQGIGKFCGFQRHVLRILLLDFVAIPFHKRFFYCGDICGGFLN